MLQGIEKTFEDGETIFRQGDVAADMYLIRSGEVRIARVLDDGAEQQIAILSPNEFFGEIALFDGGPRTATATAVGTVMVEAIDRPALMEAVHKDPDVKELLAEMSARIRELQDAE